MILDSKGKAFPQKKARSMAAVVFKSVDLEQWVPIHSNDVPEIIKSNDVMGLMLDGEIVSESDEYGPFYYAVKTH